MRAAVITRPGGPEVLEIQERPTPTPRPGEVLVRVHASALNRADLLQRAGNYPAPPGAPADIPGMEFAGEIAGLGAGVTGCHEGDRVFGITPGGANAEFLTVDAGAAAPIPTSLSWTDAAAIPEAFITAHDAMVTQANVISGERVLIHAIGSGVGLAATQLARVFGALPYGTARTAEKVERAKEYGLEDGVVVSESVDVIPPAVEKWTSGKGMEIILDLVAGPYVAANVRSAALRGRIMLIGTVAGREATVPIGMVLGKRLTLRGTVLRARSVEEKRLVTAAFVRDVVPKVDSGEIRATVDEVFPLERIAAAHERLAGNQTFGKVVIEIVGRGALGAGR